MASGRRVTHNRVPDNRPTWSPDGRRIAFVRFDVCNVCPAERPGDGEILVINADGTRAIRLTHNGLGEGSPGSRPRTAVTSSVP
jgi:Tol biopolymer transport system component